MGNFVHRTLVESRYRLRGCHLYFAAERYAARLRLPASLYLLRPAVEGGVISPLLANLFLHVVFDQWMHKYYPAVLFERYADDIVVHCATRTQAEKLHDAIAQRMAACGLSLHPDKTKVVCCDPKVKANAEFPTQFDFLGFTFRKRAAKRRDGKLFTGFSPAFDV